MTSLNRQNLTQRTKISLKIFQFENVQNRKIVKIVLFVHLMRQQQHRHYLVYVVSTGKIISQLYAIVKN